MYEISFYDVQPIDHQIIYGFSMIFCHSFISDVILRRFFTKPRLILAYDKNGTSYVVHRIDTMNMTENRLQ
jgi:hypothetical protein